MAGPTIDHIVSIVILVAVLTLSFAVYNQVLANAIAYERNRQVAMKAMDLMDTICLSPGNPPDWGQSNSIPLGFGLQDPESAGYTLSPFSIMRLRSSVNGELVYYPKTGLYYNNVSLDGGGSLLMPLGNCINYTTAARLLGVNGTYGFRITIAPTLNVSISEVPSSYLVLKVKVRGPGLAVSGATLNYHMHQVVQNPDPDVDVPLILTQSGVAQTDSSGSALIEFSIDPDNAYSFIVYAHLGGLNGVGYYSHDALEGYPPFIIPFIKNFEQGTIIIAHNWDVHFYGRPVPDVKYNATFFVLTENFELRQVQIVNSTGHLNYGEGKPYNTTQVPASESGILFISYRWGNRFGTIMVPWGISTLGVSVTFGDQPSYREWVATELRQVIVNDMSYQVKLAVWSLKD